MVSTVISCVSVLLGSSVTQCLARAFAQQEEPAGVAIDVIHTRNDDFELFSVVELVYFVYF